MKRSLWCRSWRWILEGDDLYIVKANREIPEASVFRCECCQDEYEERRQE